jgi:asparagine synthase (glutamine-hydrolysing)
MPYHSPIIFEKHKYEQPPLNNLRAQLLQIFRNPSHFSIPARPMQKTTIQHLQDVLNKKCLLQSFENHASYRWLELQTYVLFDLNPTLDFSSMRFGLEVRTPFLDYRVVERLLTTPPEHLVTHEEGRKSPLKKALCEFGIPERCFRRNKLGFSLKTNLAQNLETLQAQASDSLRQRGLLKISALSLNDKRSWTYLMATALALEIWCKEWIDAGIVEYDR